MREETRGRGVGGGEEAEGFWVHFGGAGAALGDALGRAAGFLLGSDPG